MNDKPMIDPENMPLWTAVGFIVAVMALALAVFSVYKMNKITMFTQAEILILNKKIEDLRKPAPAPKAQATEPAKVEPAAAK